MQNVNQIVSQALGQTNVSGIPPHLINTSGPTPQQIAAGIQRFNELTQNRYNSLF